MNRLFFECLYEDCVKNPQEIFKEMVIAMASNTVVERNVEIPPEIENDMHTKFKHTKYGKLSIQDYVEVIAARYPLIGMAILDESS